MDILTSPTPSQRPLLPPRFFTQRVFLRGRKTDYVAIPMRAVDHATLQQKIAGQQHLVTHYTLRRIDADGKIIKRVRMKKKHRRVHRTLQRLAADSTHAAIDLHRGIDRHQAAELLKLAIEEPA